MVNDHPLPVLDLDQHVEGRRGLALEDRLLCAAASRLLVGERDRVDAAHKVGESRIHQQVFERIAVRGADQLHPALGDRAGGDRLQLAPDLVDDDRLGHVVLDRLDHHLVLQRRRGHLHAPGAADRRVGDVAVARDLVARIDDDDPLLVAEHARGLAQQRRLADAGPPQQQQTAAAHDDVLDDVDHAVDRTADAAGQADHRALAIADGGDAVQGALDAGAVVRAEIADVADHLLQVVTRRLVRAERELRVGEARLGQAAEVHHDLDQVGGAAQLPQRAANAVGQNSQQQVQVVRYA